MPDKYEHYYSAFLGILQNEGNISNFLDCFFSFLYRRTDFYALLQSPTDKLGFPPGVSKKLLLTAFQKYEKLASEDRKRKDEQTQKDKKSNEENEKVPEVARVEEVTSTDSAAISSASSSGDTKSSNLLNNSKPATLSDAKCTVVGSVESQTKPAAAPTVDSSASDDSSKEAASANKDEKDKDVVEKKVKDGTSNSDEEDDDPELTRLQKVFQSNPESYNGAIRDSFCWSQSISDVDARIKIPKHIRKGKDVHVEVGKKHLKVACRDTTGQQMVVVVDDDLTWECHKDQTVWSLVPGEHVHVNLEKVQERWWDSLLAGEPKINIRKIDPSRPMTDLDDEAQAKIEEMMYNEQQKRLGKPQSHEKKVHEMLAAAWDAEGSPFKGQPFDPSRFNVSNSSM